MGRPSLGVLKLGTPFLVRGSSGNSVTELDRGDKPRSPL